MVSQQSPNESSVHYEGQCQPLGNKDLGPKELVFLIPPRKSRANILPLSLPNLNQRVVQRTVLRECDVVHGGCGRSFSVRACESEPLTYSSVYDFADSWPWGSSDSGCEAGSEQPDPFGNHRHVWLSAANELFGKNKGRWNTKDGRYSVITQVMSVLGSWRSPASGTLCCFCFLYLWLVLMSHFFYVVQLSWSVSTLKSNSQVGNPIKSVCKNIRVTSLLREMKYCARRLCFLYTTYIVWNMTHARSSLKKELHTSTCLWSFIQVLTVLW